MKIIKFGDYIKEDLFQDTPEEYVATALKKLKTKIDSFFEQVEETENDKEVMAMKKAIEKGEERKSKEGKMSFKELNVQLESSEISKYSAQFDSVKVIFSDPEYRYDLFITIPLEEAINKDKTKEFSEKDIKSCTYKFKKYDLDNFELIGQIGPKKVDIDKVDEDFLVSLKIELDDEFGGEEETLEFET